jgi:hypothetical protein
VKLIGKLLIAWGKKNIFNFLILAVPSDRLKIEEVWRDKYVKNRFECKICPSHYDLWSSLFQHCQAVHSGMNHIYYPTNNEQVFVF